MMCRVDTMWDVEPTLYWRVKRDGKWAYERARFAFTATPGQIQIEYPKPEVKVNESEN